eukprot:6184061-Pleurochrysis_carterae.AAC.4
MLLRFLFDHNLSNGPDQEQKPIAERVCTALPACMRRFIVRWWTVVVPLEPVRYEVHRNAYTAQRRCGYGRPF